VTRSPALGDDLVDSWRALNQGAGTRQNKRLPAATVAPEIPARSGVAPHVTKPTSGAGEAINLTLKGAKVVTSSDGLITINYPESAEVIVGTTTLVLPAISKS